MPPAGSSDGPYVKHLRLEGSLDRDEYKAPTELGSDGLEEMTFNVPLMAHNATALGCRALNGETFVTISSRA
jgi:hypothetical protein